MGSIVNAVRFKNAIDKVAEGLRESADALAALGADLKTPEDEGTEAEQTLGELVENLRASAEQVELVKKTVQDLFVDKAKGR